MDWSKLHEVAVMDKPKVEGKPLPTIKRLRRVVGRILAERAQEGWRYRIV